MPAISLSQRNGSYSTAIVRNHAAYAEVCGSVQDSSRAISVILRTYEWTEGARIAQPGHLSLMAVFGYLTTVRDAWPRRRQPSETGCRACGGCSRRGGARYADSGGAALRSHDRRDRAPPRREFRVRDLTAGRVRTCRHRMKTAAAVPALGGTRGRSNRRHRATGSASCLAAE